ncbi:hypothetical protein GCM10023191_022640 [Actinoallomurus oryzae]|uniref:Uncharacterized protein n=1 Tax=Actinoallomurus oryzae TaxID=502180 RepID=A0ABP8PP12_9ACTN
MALCSGSGLVTPPSSQANSRAVAASTAAGIPGTDAGRGAGGQFGTVSVKWVPAL